MRNGSLDRELEVFLCYKKPHACRRKRLGLSSVLSERFAYAKPRPAKSSFGRFVWPSVGRHKSKLLRRSSFRPHRLTVRTGPSQGPNPGAIPGGVTPTYKPDACHRVFSRCRGPYRESQDGGERGPPKRGTPSPCPDQNAEAF